MDTIITVQDVLIQSTLSQDIIWILAYHMSVLYTTLTGSAVHVALGAPI